MTIPILYSLLSVLLALLLRPSSGDTLPQDIFILAGQSNMAGRGGVENDKWNGFVPPQCRPNPSILRLSAQLTWSEAAEPLHADIDVDRVCGVGPGMSFANAIKSKDPRLGVVGLVPCAVGGTKIAQWARGTPLYNQMVSRATAAVKTSARCKTIQNLTRGSTWESDTVVQAEAEAYRTNMEKLIGDIRTDLNSPSLLIIQVALASGEGKFVDTVRSAQLGITLPNVKCVDAKGLDLKTDHLHLTTTSQVRLGSMLADAFLASQ
ncbi:hypothetical protein ACJRO7_022426 [Eucalyptus globulus]|uniref:Sialate O-acetylesterase domain-containing protein n=1 Tax=Eucalyptus globulus TaxID=34317 RepID=A0ABD3JYD2_EUCGL